MELINIFKEYDIENKILNGFNCKRIPHAIIIEGLSDEESEIRVGIAKIIASYLVCRCNEKKPCFECTSCLKVVNNNHPDILKIGDDGTSKSFHIDKIRTLRQDAFIVPNEADYKVYILDYANNMTISAQNALLKVLEEPPESVVFILLCKSSTSLLQTIKSRCQIFSFESFGHKLYDKRAEDCVRDIVKGILLSTDWELIIATSKLIKDKILFRNVLNILTDIFSEALRETFGLSENIEPFAEESKMLSLRLTKSSLIKLIESLDRIKVMLEQNANMNLLVSSMCSKLRSCVVA